VILSNQEGLDFALNELKRLDITFPTLLATGRIFAQPNKGYIGAIDWILNSDCYFQRSGGGMGVVAIFSSVPYVMYSIEKTSFLDTIEINKLCRGQPTSKFLRDCLREKSHFLFLRAWNGLRQIISKFEP
jgi:hypothetical protein